MTDYTIVHLTWAKASVLYKQSVTELNKWESKHWLCTIHNGSLETFIWSIMRTKKFKYCELSQFREEIFVIGVILETPMDASLETPMGPYFHWKTAYFYCRPQSHIFVGDPQIFIRDSQILLETPYFRWRSIQLYWNPPDFHLILGTLTKIWGL